MSVGRQGAFSEEMTPGLLKEPWGVGQVEHVQEGVPDRENDTQAPRTYVQQSRCLSVVECRKRSWKNKVKPNVIMQVRDDEL